MRAGQVAWRFNNCTCEARTWPLASVPFAETVGLARIKREAAGLACAGGLAYGSAMSIAVEPDHLREAHERQVAIYRAMSPQQRLAQAMRMNQSMRALMAAGFRARHPDWTDAEIKRTIAERILYARAG